MSAANEDEVLNDAQRTCPSDILLTFLIVPNDPRPVQLLTYEINDHFAYRKYLPIVSRTSYFSDSVEVVMLARGREASNVNAMSRYA